MAKPEHLARVITMRLAGSVSACSRIRFEGRALGRLWEAYERKAVPRHHPRWEPGALAAPAGICRVLRPSQAASYPVSWRARSWWAGNKTSLQNTSALPQGLAAT
jgi:hypothetical protein